MLLWLVDVYLYHNDTWSNLELHYTCTADFLTYIFHEGPNKAFICFIREQRFYRISLAFIVEIYLIEKFNITDSTVKRDIIQYSTFILFMTHAVHYVFVSYLLISIVMGLFVRQLHDISPLISLSLSIQLSSKICTFCRLR